MVDSLGGEASGSIPARPREESADLDRTFAALADPTRRAILARLSQGSATVGKLAEPFPISLNAVSKHVRVLERAGLLAREVRGREHHCGLEPGPLRAASEWTQHYRAFWEARLDALSALLERDRHHGSGDRGSEAGGAGSAGGGT